MRHHGVVCSAGGLGVHDHACLPFDDDEDFRSAAVQFLTDGRRLGQRLIYVGGDPVEKLRDDLEELEDLEALIDRGGLEIQSLPAVYRVGEPIDAAAQLAAYAEATERALGDGYTGLRAAGNGTALVSDPVTWAAFVRWETVADRFMASRPLAGLCCFDRRSLPDGLIADLASVHPVVYETDTRVPFRLFALGRALMLEGEVDYFSAQALDRLLAAVDSDEDELVLDLSGLRFIDHHALFVLARHGRRLAAHGRKMSVRRAPGAVRRSCEILNLAL